MEKFFEVLGYYILPFILAIGVLVLVHELGHFLFAKMMGIRVERFSIGFPPRLFGKKIGDTDYCISAIPLGGYVKMSGMIDESMDTEITGEPYEFMSKPVWKRALVIFAGPLFNIVFAILVVSVSIMATGISMPKEQAKAIVGSVQEESPAAGIGLQAGDQITSINGEAVNSWEDLVSKIHDYPEEDMQITWMRNGEEMTANVTPKHDELLNASFIGIGAQTERRAVGPLAALGFGVSSSWNLTKLMGRSIYMWVTGQSSVKEGLAGPVRIAQMTGEVAKRGFGDLVSFIALISLNLGLVNLLPIPVLDGGHLVLLGVEAVNRRPPSMKVRVVVQQIGMALLLALMVFVVVNDFLHITN